MKSIMLIAIGVLLILVSLWGGGWLINQFPFGSGYSFSAFATAVIVFILGVVSLVVGLAYSKLF